MGSSPGRHAVVGLFFCLHFFIFVTDGVATMNTKQRPLNNSITALLVFGDSTVDPGNNNYVGTIFRANFLPYGEDFPGQTPTGRFSNGRLTTDFIASYVGVKENVPPYLDPTLRFSELMTGVSFASAGTGYDPLTPTITSVVPIPQQLEYFKEYKKKLEARIGRKGMEEHIKKSMFLISAGTNDFVINYFTLPVRRQTYSVSSYQQFIIQHVKQFIQGLWDEGARRLAVAGLPPMGCLPAVITMNSNDIVSQRGCIESYNAAAREYNLILQNEVDLMNLQFAGRGGRIYVIDIYSPLLDMIQGRRRSDFDEVSCGCCGSGIIEAGFLCNPGSLVCSDASKYVFFDAIHPTEKSHYNLFKSCHPIIDRLL